MIGWTGKLPSLGDFASRRLAPDFLDTWNEWVCAGLGAWQARDPDWSTAYLASPSWRFIAPARSLHDAVGAHAGVVMPSLDRVGRYYPLMVATPLRSLPSAHDNSSWARLGTLLERLDDAAYSAMSQDWSSDTFDAALAAAEQADSSASAQPWLTAWAGRRQSNAEILWWHSAPHSATRVQSSEGLPQPAQFDAWLQGRQAREASEVATA